MLNPGETLHHYTIVGPKGNGVYGHVFEAQDSSNSNESLALKLLTNNLGDNEARFRAENDHLYTLINEPYVIGPKTRVLNINGRIIYCMELADTNTESFLSANTLTTSQTLNLFKKIAQGLKAAHDNGIVHRDLHLGNILLMTSDPQNPLPKLTDFGMAKDFNGSDMSSIPVQVWGAVGMRPPEIFFMLWDAPDLDKYMLADVYALGILLHCLLNTRPTQYILGLVSSVVDVFTDNNAQYNQNTYQIDPALDIATKKQCYDEWLNNYNRANQDNLRIILSSNDPILEKEINRIIQKCCAVDYNDRYQNVDELIQEVNAIC